MANFCERSHHHSLEIRRLKYQLDHVLDVADGKSVTLPVKIFRGSFVAAKVLKVGDISVIRGFGWPERQLYSVAVERVWLRPA